MRRVEQANGRVESLGGPVRVKIHYILALGMNVMSNRGRRCSLGRGTLETEIT